MSQLTTEQHILVEQRVANDGKSLVVAYILWIFFGGLGGHRFYLGRIASGVVLLALTVIGGATLFVYVGIPMLLIAALWAILDAFLIPGMVRSERDRLRNRLMMDMIQAKAM